MPMAQDFDFKDLAQCALQYSQSIVPELLSGGRIIGQEWVCGSKFGGPGDSMRVNLNTGKWADFATDERGLDLISLAKCCRGGSMLEAGKWVAERINYRFIDVPTNGKKHTALPKPEDTLIKPPGDYVPDFTHFKFGKPSMVWPYRDEKGEPLFWVARYDVQGQGKQFAPWSYSKEKKKAIMKGWPRPRPLYNLDKLAARPTASVLVVEGEKSVVGAEKLGAEKNYVVTTWPNGSKAFANADWSPLKDRKVLIWPDADEPGRTAANQIAQLLGDIAKEIKVINPDREDGWDAADALTDEMKWTDVVQWAKKRVTTFEPTHEPELVSHPTKQNNVTKVEHSVQLGDERDPASQSQEEYLKSLGVSLNKSSKPYQNVHNLIKIFSNAEEFQRKIWYDLFDYRVYTDILGETQELNDHITVHVASILQKKYSMMTVTTNMVSEAITAFATTVPRHAVRDWIHILEWDQKPRVGRFFQDYLRVDDNEYTEAVSHNFWVGMIARAFLPGCKNDHMVVLEGAQGIGKSMALSKLGGKWHAETTESFGSKDFYQNLHGKLIVEIAELDSFSKAEVTRVKQVVTAQSDRFRPSYGRFASDYPRQCIFVGTTNEHSYLRDATGARRFWPLTCRGVNIDKINHDREQLFAEAYHLFKRGDNWHEVPSERAIEAQEDRYQHDELEVRIREYIKGKSFIIMADMAKDHFGLSADRFDTRCQRRFGSILRRAGWERRRETVNGEQERIWMPVDAPPLVDQELFPGDGVGFEDS